MSSAICFNLDQSKILSSGNGLTKIVNSYHYYFAAFNDWSMKQNSHLKNKCCRKYNV